MLLDKALAERLLEKALITRNGLKLTTNDPIAARTVFNEVRDLDRKLNLGQSRYDCLTFFRRNTNELWIRKNGQSSRDTETE